MIQENMSSPHTLVRGPRRWAAKWANAGSNRTRKGQGSTGKLLVTIFALTFQTVGRIIESSPPILLVSRSCLSDPRGVDCFDHYLQHVLYLVFA